MARTNSQAQTGVNFDFEVKFDLKGQGQSTPKIIWILTKVFYPYGSNLVILVLTVMSYRADKLGDGRTDGRTDGLTDGQTDGRTDASSHNTWRPKLPSGKMNKKQVQNVRIPIKSTCRRRQQLYNS